MFIKNGDDPKSKILTIVDSDEVSDDLKKSVKEALVKQKNPSNNSNCEVPKTENN